jgi:aspartyl-tRNA(Asn)/glutamyl-tRNA(Gln) amidotransferase subunit C
LKITPEQVRHVAGLANLKLTESEVERMTSELDSILTYVDALNEADTTGVEPMAQVLVKDAAAALREDVERPSLSNADAVANAPLAGAGFFKVPLVIER